MTPAARTRIDIEVDAAHLAQVMRRYDVSEAGAAVDLALELTASAPMPHDEPSEHRDAELVEEVVSVQSLHRFTSP